MASPFALHSISRSGRRPGRDPRPLVREAHPPAMACLAEDLEACLGTFTSQRSSARRIRITNLLERLFAEGKHRTNVVPRFLGKSACLRPVFATLLNASETWHGAKMTPETLREVDRLRAGHANVEERELVAV